MLFNNAEVDELLDELIASTTDLLSKHVVKGGQCLPDQKLTLLTGLNALI